MEKWEEERNAMNLDHLQQSFIRLLSPAARREFMKWAAKHVKDYHKPIGPERPQPIRGANYIEDVKKVRLERGCSIAEARAV